jgi:hypothetical protein
MQQLEYSQWVIIAKDLLNKQVEILRAPYENQIGTVIDIWADGKSTRVINVEAPDGTFLEQLQPNEYRKI